jgi:hypothetical protein
MRDLRETSLSEAQAGGHSDAGDTDEENQRRDAAEVDNE